jgi:hypothetical protein
MSTFSFVLTNSLSRQIRVRQPLGRALAEAEDNSDSKIGQKIGAVTTREMADNLNQGHVLA